MDAIDPVMISVAQSRISFHFSYRGCQALDAFADVIQGGGAKTEADGIPGDGARGVGAVAIGAGDVEDTFLNGLGE